MTMTCPECSGRTLENGEVYLLCTEHFQRYFREKQATETCTGAAVKDEFTRREEQAFLDAAAIGAMNGMLSQPLNKDALHTLAPWCYMMADALLAERRIRMIQ